MKKVMKLSSGMVVTVTGLSLDDIPQKIAPDMRLEAFKSLVRNPSKYQGSFEAIDGQVKTSYLPVCLPFRFGPAPDFEIELST